MQWGEVGVMFLLPFLPRILGALAIAAAVAFGLHQYNGYIRAPLLKQITLLEDLRKADADSAAKQMAARKIENEKALQGYVEYAREADNKYVTDLAALNRLRDHAAALKRGSPAGQAGASDTGTPESAAPAVATGSCPDSDSIAIYAAEIRLYAQSYYEFVNQK